MVYSSEVAIIMHTISLIIQLLLRTEYIGSAIKQYCKKQESKHYIIL